MRGTVKWFDANKGYGFIESPGSEDVFVHVTALPFGTSLAEGDTIEFDVEVSPRGRNAVHVIVIERSGLPPRPHGSAGPTRLADPFAAVDPTTLPLERGTVVRYDAEKGFGFIDPQTGGEQVFFHRSVAPVSIRTGCAVEYRRTSGPKGPRAVAVTEL